VFTPWGPPDFYTCSNAGEGVGALLQARHGVEGRALPGLEVTFGVDEIGAAAARVRDAGGEVLTAPYHIEGVGHHVFIANPEGAVFALMQHETEARA
jgi:predicted enzyme related to lactoylglutathione lyase